MSVIHYNFFRDASLSIEKIKFFNPFSSFKRTKSSSFICPIQGDKWIIITTIFYPTSAVHKFLELKSPWDLIAIGDRKTPHDWLSRLNENRSRLLYLSLDDQYSLDYSILQYIPKGSYGYTYSSSHYISSDTIRSMQHSFHYEMNRIGRNVMGRTVGVPFNTVVLFLV
jgi:hypothetical protein